MGRLSLAYIVTEAGCMDPTTGAYQHITVGVKELSKYADVQEFFPEAPAKTKSGAGQGVPERGVSRVLKNTLLRGALRDIRDFSARFFRDLSLARRVKQSGVDVVYFRMDFPSFVTVFLPFFHVRVFIEANGIRHLERKTQARSVFQFVYEPLERYLYRKADHVFFVGSMGEYWNLSAENWTNVENGVEPTLFQSRERPAGQGDTLKLVLVAKLMAHHRGSLLSEAIGELDPSLRDRVEVHLVGSGFDVLRSELAPLCPVVDHGFVARDEIGALLRDMDCGVIPDCPPFASQMKLLDYAACGCLVVAPDVFHIRNFYADKGVLFFEQGDSASLAEALEALIRGRIPVGDMARDLQSHVQETYTWDAIFDRKWSTIRASCGED